jgi:site-specific recombinase
MKYIALRTLPIIKQKTTNTKKMQKALNRWNYTLIFSMIGGVFLSLSGLILGTISYLNVFKNAARANFIANLMIIASFPLLMLGAHALDKISFLKKEEKKLAVSKKMAIFK